ncbi:hypothetical protein SDC9_122163 [bioreactor metagenome]|uniref:Uncharacterized protein n=1 Tax=bioreactor metagenome TaxID=1076179 RepID=A0A645CE81_9ZZZZ
MAGHVHFMEGFHAVQVGSISVELPICGDGAEKVSAHQSLLFRQIAHDGSGKMEVRGENEADGASVFHGVGVLVMVDQVEGALEAVVLEQQGSSLVATEHPSKACFLKEGDCVAEIGVLVAEDNGF